MYHPFKLFGDKILAHSPYRFFFEVGYREIADMSLNDIDLVFHLRFLVFCPILGQVEIE